MTYSYFCGWDVSKKTLDYHLINHQGKEILHGKISNTKSAIQHLLARLDKQLQDPKTTVLHCAEITGVYSEKLAYTLVDKQYACWMEDPFQIKACSGRMKDKTDSLDAARIALYAYRFVDQVKLWRKPDEILATLRFVRGQRGHLVEARKRIQTSIKELESESLVGLDSAALTIMKNQVEAMTSAIQQLEDRLRSIIQQDESVERLYNIATSVKGIGDKTAITLIIETGLFKKVPTAKKCASYAGISPHRFESGSSVRQRHRTSKASAGGIRTILTMGARSTLQKDSVFKRKYDRLRARGRTYLQALNAVRNQMLIVLYACVKNDTMYDENYHNNLQNS